MGDLAAALTVSQGEGRTGGAARFCDLECLSISFNGNGVTVQTEGDISIDLDTTELGVQWGLQNEVAGKVVGAAIGQHTLIGLILCAVAAAPHVTVIILRDRRRKGGLTVLVMAAQVAARFSIAAEVVGVRCRRFRLAVRECRRRQQRQAQGQRQKQAQSSFFHILLPFLSKFSCWQSKANSVFLVCKS